MKKILIFDMNGVLCKRVRNLDHKKYKMFDLLDDIIVRPNIINFLNKLSLKYKIAFWTSGSEKRMKLFVKYILENVNFSPEFIWYGNQFLFSEKNLGVVTNYKSKHKLIVDDTYSKVCVNENFIVPKKFDRNKNLKDQEIELDDLYLEILNHKFNESTHCCII